MARLRGNQWSFTSSGLSINVSLDDMTAFVAQYDLPLFEVTPVNYSSERVEPGTPKLRGLLRGNRETGAATPTVPDGTVGTLTLLFQTGKSWAFKAFLYNLHVNGQSTGGGPPTEFQYGFVRTRTTTASSDDLTVTG